MGNFPLGIRFALSWSGGLFHLSNKATVRRPTVLHCEALCHFGSMLFYSCAVGRLRLGQNTNGSLFVSRLLTRGKKVQNNDHACEWVIRISIVVVEINPFAHSVHFGEPLLSAVWIYKTGKQDGSNPWLWSHTHAMQHSL